ncbi:HAD hydrolase-like protein [Candidatus Daviesbacteria bacterium]|nr:HAD hydrolase-like protein [Candidatus Daviesbacteria bacterium]
MMKKAIFTNEETFKNGAMDELSILQTAGFSLVIVSNQSGLDEGLFNEMDPDLDLSESWMIGDTLDDIEAGSRAGCHTILINSGQETNWRITANCIPDFVVTNLQDAARLILASEQQAVITERKYVT